MGFNLLFCFHCTSDVTGVAETVIAQQLKYVQLRIYSLTLKLYSSTIQKHQAYGYRQASLFFRESFMLTLSNHEYALQSLWSQWTVLIKMCEAPSCCQWLSRLILWLVSVSVTYWRHSIAGSVLIEDITFLQLPHHHTSPLPATHLCMCQVWHYRCCEKLFKIQ